MDERIILSMLSTTYKYYIILVCWAYSICMDWQWLLRNKIRKRLVFQNQRDYKHWKTKNKESELAWQQAGGPARARCGAARHND